MGPTHPRPVTGRLSPWSIYLPLGMGRALFPGASKVLVLSLARGTSRGWPRALSVPGGSGLAGGSLTFFYAILPNRGLAFAATLPLLTGLMGLSAWLVRAR
ncbi:hypothetical protein [Thermus caldifontis]|uniref:hypothetical protein n=1 Tax=Thermus caldifontis TaxID=1930763 RepID=UPI001962A18B|nr:hypothetical protein [Thermus caldifontis]